MRYKLILIDGDLPAMTSTKLVREVVTTDCPRVALDAADMAKRVLQAADKRSKEPKYFPTAPAKPEPSKAIGSPTFTAATLGVSPATLEKVQMVINKRRTGKGLLPGLDAEVKALLEKLWTPEDEAVMQARLEREKVARAIVATQETPTATASPETSPATVAGPVPGGALNRS